MTFSLNEVLVTLLAMAQFTNPTPNIVTSYDPTKPEIIAADISKGCRSMFSSPDFMSAEQVDTLVTEIKSQRSKLKAPETLVQNDPDEESSDVKIDAPIKGLPKQIQEKAGSFKAPAGLEDGDTDYEKNEDGSEISLDYLKSNEKLGKMLEGLKLFPDLNLDQMLNVWDGVCRKKVDLTMVPNMDWDEIAFKYNNAVKTLPDYKVLKGYRLPETSYIYDAEGNPVREMFNNQGRRTWVPLANIPKNLQNAFISAEDRTFYSHNGIDPQGILKGFSKYVQAGEIAGGSTITQQVIKNILVGTSRDLDRKTREMLLAKLIDGHTAKSNGFLSKDEILEIYLNLIYMGRSSWGVEIAAKNYFGKSVSELNLTESAFLAGITHSPSRYEPSNPRDKREIRINYVLDQMVKNNMITQAEATAAKAFDLSKSFIEAPEVAKGNDYVASSVRSALLRSVPADRLKQGGLRIRTTIRPGLQELTQASLQEGLYEYEVTFGRIKWKGPVAHIEALENGSVDTTQWTGPLSKLIEQYSDIQWDFAVVLGKEKRNWVLGLSDGSTAYLTKPSGWAVGAASQLNAGDVVFVKAETDGSYSLRTAPSVEGAVVVMDAKTGRVFAISGGFSATYSQGDDALDENNRAINSYRQPGSTVKPFTYLAALQAGLQPNTLVPNRAIGFGRVRENGTLKCQGWSPGNYKNGAPVLTLRRGLETSNNRVTAQILKSFSPDGNFMQGLDQVRDIARELGAYDDPYDCISFILGSDETTPLRMATAYAAIANGGNRVSPRFLDNIEDLNSKKVTFNKPTPQPLESADPVSVYQLRSLLEGTVVRGTARRIQDLAGYVAGKTGTSNNSYNAWFVGFSKELVISVWVGYDRDRNLGNPGQDGTGGSVALPIFEKIIRTAFDKGLTPKLPFAEPPPGITLSPTSVKCADYVPDGLTRFTSRDVVNEAFRTGAEDTTYFIMPYNPCGNGERNYSDSPSQAEPVKRKKKKQPVFTSEDPSTDDGFFQEPTPVKKKKKKKKWLFDLY